MPGDHDSMVLVPNVSVLAAEVKARLDRAEAGYTAPAPEHAGQVRNQAAE